MQDTTTRPYSHQETRLKDAVASTGHAPGTGLLIGDTTTRGDTSGTAASAIACMDSVPRAHNTSSTTTSVSPPSIMHGTCLGLDTNAWPRLSYCV